MEINNRKEQFSKAFVNALSAQAGFRTCELNVDDDSVDLIIKGRGFKGKFRNPQIEVQLKCTAIDDNDTEILKFKLPIKNYDDLRGDDLTCPRYLFILVVPENIEKWLVQATDHSQIFHVCYWYSLNGLPDVLNTSKVTLKIPKTQRLTSESINTLLQLAVNWGQK